jgi:5-methylcytosine-specific restriction endonuclease McrA
MPKSLQSIRITAFERQAGRCYYCGVAMWLTTSFELDGCTRECSGYRLLQCTAEHLVARKDGGRNGGGNVVAACAHCNHTRHKRKKPPAPDIYRNEVMRRVRAGQWHPAWVHTKGFLRRLE